MNLYVKAEIGEEVLSHGRHNADMGSSEIRVSNGINLYIACGWVKLAG